MKITIVNGKTIKKRIKQTIAVALLGSVIYGVSWYPRVAVPKAYAHRKLEQLVENKRYEDSLAYFDEMRSKGLAYSLESKSKWETKIAGKIKEDILNLAGKKEYAEAKRLLSSQKEKLPEKLESELNAKIETIHPDKIIAQLGKAKTKKERVELLSIADKQYTKLGIDDIKLSKKVVDGYFNILESELNAPKLDFIAVNDDLYSLALYIQELRKKKNEISIDGKRLEGIFEKSKRYIDNKDDPSIPEDIDYTVKDYSAFFINSLIVYSLNKETEEGMTKKLFGYYVEHAKKVIASNDFNSPYKDAFVNLMGDISSEYNMKKEVPANLYAIIMERAFRAEKPSPKRVNKLLVEFDEYLNKNKVKSLALDKFFEGVGVYMINLNKSEEEVTTETRENLFDKCLSISKNSEEREKYQKRIESLFNAYIKYSKNAMNGNYTDEYKIAVIKSLLKLGKKYDVDLKQPLYDIFSSSLASAQPQTQTQPTSHFP